jgi:hypothetical protein
MPSLSKIAHGRELTALLNPVGIVASSTPLAKPSASDMKSEAGLAPEGEDAAHRRSHGSRGVARRRLRHGRAARTRLGERTGGSRRGDGPTRTDRNCYSYAAAARSRLGFKAVDDVLLGAASAPAGSQRPAPKATTMRTSVISP